MNNRFKFRVWNKREKLFYIPKYHTTNCAISLDGTVCYRYIDGDMVTEEDENNVTIQQFTGLKDKNGKEIYEGDIISQLEDLDKDCCYDDVTTYIKITQVEFYNGFFTLDKDEPFDLVINSTNGQYNFGEVIGNIFENPELLNV